MRRWLPRVLPLLAAATLSGCENELPTAVDEDLVPVGPVTFEVRVPWSQFAANLRVLGGFGSPSELGRGYLANGFGGVLHARTLVHLAGFPASASVRDSLGTTRVDDDLTFEGGRLIVTFDTVASTNAAPVTITAGRTLTSWHARSATWELAADTAGVEVPWGEPGGGPVEVWGSAVWDRTKGDTAIVLLDSAQVAALGDSAQTERGVRVAVETAGERLQVNSVVLALTTRPSIHRDTLIELPVAPVEMTFIYTPHADPPASGLRVGGAPAWRTVLDLALPASVPGPAEACAVVACPLVLTPERVTHAALVLTSTATDPAFQPSDTVQLDVRAVLAPEALPKSPLGPPLYPDVTGEATSIRVLPAAFRPGGARTVDVPITPLIRDLVRGETEEGRAPSPTLALLSRMEPLSISYATFAGPGEAGEPFLRLLLTISDRVELP